MRVTIGSPIYDRPEPAMVTCLIATLNLLRERGHEADWRYASNITHVARNWLMADMLKHMPDVLVQIDGDHQWSAEDAVDAIEAVGEGSRTSSVSVISTAGLSAPMTLRGARRSCAVRPVGGSSAPASTTSRSLRSGAVSSPSRARAS